MASLKLQFLSLPFGSIISHFIHIEFHIIEEVC